MIDSSNFTIAIVGYLIVFVALLLLYAVFANLPKLLNLRLRRKRQNNAGQPSLADKGKFIKITGQENAAVATAVYLYLYQLHDEENTVMTIKRVKKDYTPWSSKIYAMNQLHR